LRNDTFERILTNLRRLVEAKGGTEGLPKVLLIFMPMRANVHELEPFIKLCAELQVDQLVLRPLNTTLGNDLKWDRAGYHFDYDQEILPFDQLVRVSGQAAALCRRYGVELVDQLDFGGELESLFDKEYSEGRDNVSTDTTPPAATRVAPTEPVAPEKTAGLESAEKPSLGTEKWPICTEPWTNLYILRRGVMPCSYGWKPIAEMDDYRRAWNSSLLQEIRDDLRNGKLHTYCLSSKACPILRKWERAHKLPPSQRASLWIHRLWKGVNAVTAGLPRRALRDLRALAPRSNGRTNPKAK
jgi:MoaA/NifB/PqqE/SkfB family radical SAM enzyme